MKYKAKKGFADMKDASSALGNNKHQKLLNNKTIEIDTLPKGWDKFVDSVSTKAKKEDKEV